MSDKATPTGSEANAGTAGADASTDAINSMTFEQLVNRRGRLNHSIDKSIEKSNRAIERYHSAVEELQKVNERLNFMVENVQEEAKVKPAKLGDVRIEVPTGSLKATSQPGG